MRTSPVVLALALLACDDVGTPGTVGALVADADPDAWSPDGAWIGGDEDAQQAQLEVARPDTPPPEGVCYDGPADGEVVWRVTPESMGDALPWRCAPRRMAECAAVVTLDGCKSYRCRDSETDCWVPVFTFSDPNDGPGIAACCPLGPETVHCDGVTAWAAWWASYCDE